MVNFDLEDRCVLYCVKAPVFVIVRFPINRSQACKNSLMKNLSVHHNYSGDVSGISRMVSLCVCLSVCLSVFLQLNVTSCTFNQLSQYVSIPVNRVLLRRTRRFFPSSGRDHRQYSLRLPTEVWRGWVDLCGWLNTKLTGERSPILVLTSLDGEQLGWRARECRQNAVNQLGF